MGIVRVWLLCTCIHALSICVSVGRPQCIRTFSVCHVTYRCQPELKMLFHVRTKTKRSCMMPQIEVEF